MFKTFFEIVNNDKKLKKEFKKFLYQRIKEGFGPEHKTLFVDVERERKDGVSDQQAAVVDCFDLEKVTLIIQQSCGWGKSMADACARLVQLEFYKKFKKDFLKLNGNKPLNFVITAPLTSLSAGNQLEKDIVFLMYMMYKEGFGIRNYHICSGSNATQNNDALCEKIIKLMNVEDEAEKENIRKYFKVAVVQKTTITESDITNSNIDANYIYTCDDSIEKFIKLETGLIDMLSADEAHMHWISGGGSENTKLFNNLKQFVEKNPNMIRRYYSATPTYSEGCEKSTWNRKFFGYVKTYTTFHRMIELGRALPVEGYELTAKNEKNEYISYEAFNSYTDVKKFEVISNCLVTIPEKYKNIEGTGEEHMYLLIKSDKLFFKSFYKMYKIIQEAENWEKAKFKLNRMTKNNEIPDVWVTELEMGRTIICTCSDSGAKLEQDGNFISYNAFILTSEKVMNREYKNVVELINYAKTDEFKNLYANNDIYIWNIKQLATGLDFNTINCSINFMTCNEQDYEQFFMRGGRLNGIKEKNVTFIPIFALPNEYVFKFTQVIKQLECVIGAFDGNEPFVFGEMDDKKVDSPEFVHLKKYNYSIDIEKIKKEYPKKWDSATYEDEMLMKWKAENNDNKILWRKMRNNDNYKEWLDKLMAQICNDYIRNLDDNRTFNC